MNKNLDLLDILNIMSFVLGVMNLETNLSQDDKQDLLEAVNTQTQQILEDIHIELEKQNKMLEVLINDKNKEVS